MAVRQGKKAAGAQAGAEAGNATVAPAAKSKGLTVPAIVVAVALLGAAFLMRPSGAAPAAAEAHAPEAAAEEAVPGPVVTLDPIIMNLHGGEHLKVGIALQLSAEAAEGGAHGAEALENPTAFGARALDVAIQVLGSHSVEELSAPGGRDEAKAELSAKVAEEYHDEVLEVYFTQFVIA